MLATLDQERNIHSRPVLLLDRIDVEALRGVNDVIQESGFLLRLEGLHS